MTKTCSRCDEDKPLDQFSKRGKIGHQAWCKQCIAKYDRNRWVSNPEYRDTVYTRRIRTRRHRTIWMWELKRSQPCVDCRMAYHPAAMQWDHIGTDKEADISRVFASWSKDRILKEIAKCELVCANCHAIRTYTRMHGTSPDDFDCFWAKGIEKDK